MQIVGGDKWEAVLEGIAQRSSRASHVAVGFLERATYPDGTSVALVATVQEYGAPSRGIPSRPFFRGMVRTKQGEWPRAVARLLVSNNYDARRTLEQAGAAIAGQLRQAITTFRGVPLSPATVARKGHAKQLVDTGHMLRSVDYEVR